MSEFRKLEKALDECETELARRTEAQPAAPDDDAADASIIAQPAALADGPGLDAM